MFSLIITLISIALVAALALATLYYGGDSYTSGQARANSAKVRNQGEQLLAAAEFFKVQKGRYPVNISELVDEKYLSTVPVAQRAMAEALANSEWFMPVPEESLFLIKTPQPETCRALNADSYGKPGILPGVIDTVKFQCFGTSTGTLHSMAARNPTAIGALVSADPATLTIAVPALVAALPADDASGWTVKPTDGAVAGGSSGSPPGGGGDTGGGDTGGGTDNGGGTTPTDPEPTPGALSSSVTSQDFGSITAGSEALRNIAFQNTGGTAISVEAASVTGAGFSVDADNCAGSLAAGATCAVTVKLAPSTAGDYSGALSVTSNVGTQAVTLTGSAVAAPVGILTVGAAPAAFSAEVGQSAVKTLVLQNTGNAALTFTQTPGVSGDPSFTVSGCAAGSLAAGQSCTLTITFAPGSTGQKDATLSFDTNVSEPSSIALTGTAVAAPVGILSVGTAPSAFSAEVGKTATKTVVLQNVGNASLTFTQAPTVTGDNSFTVSGCSAGTLGAGQNCTITVTFAPSSAGQKDATLSFDTNVSEPSSIALTGTATVVVATGSWKASFDGTADFTDTSFATTQVGSTATTKTIYLRRADVGVLSAAFALQGTDAQHFKFTAAPVALQDNASGTVSCGASLTNGAKNTTECAGTSSYPNIKLTVTYAPTAGGNHSVQLVATSSTGSNLPAALTFTGAGQEPLPSGYVQVGGKTFTTPRSPDAVWSTANTYCNDLVSWSKSDWRLPTRAELLELQAIRASFTSTWPVMPSLAWTSEVSSNGHWGVRLNNNDAPVNLSDVNPRQTVCVRVGT